MSVTVKREFKEEAGNLPTEAERQRCSLLIDGLFSDPKASIGHSPPSPRLHLSAPLPTSHPKEKMVYEAYPNPNPNLKVVYEGYVDDPEGALSLTLTLT